MRVALVVPDQRGGIREYSMRLAQALDRGVAVTVYTSEGDPINDVAFKIDTPFALGARPRYLPRPLRRVLAACRYLAASIYVAWVTRTSSVVHVQGLLSTWHGLLTIGLCRLAGAPLVITAHNAAPRRRRIGWRFLYRLSARAASALIVHSARAADQVRMTVGAHCPPVHIVPHGEYSTLRATSHVSPIVARVDLRIPDDASIVLLQYGHIRPYKGLRTLLLALAAIPQLRLLIVGQPDEPFAPYEGLAHRLGVADRVHAFLGYADAELTSRAFAACDLVVLPYEGEAVDQSGVGQLALAHARPLVVSTAGGLPELTDEGRCGWVFNEGDVPSLTAALVNALQGREDLQEMGERGRRFALQQFGWDKIATATLAIYRFVARG